MDKDVLLKSFGLTDKEASVYLALLELGSSTIKPIALKSGVVRSSIYTFIDHLVDLSLIDQVKLRGRMHYKALSPNKLVRIQKQRLEDVENALPILLGMFNKSDKKPKISYYEGVEQIKNIALEEIACYKEVKYIWSGSNSLALIGSKLMEYIEKTRFEKQIKLKSIRCKSEDMPFLGSYQDSAKLKEIRWFPESLGTFNISIGLYDTQKVGFISSQEEEFGVMIESKEIYNAMKMLFEALWLQSEPAKEGEG
ncbi:MAG: transcriptional regulator, TrmB [uncultured bacterium]|nr:MAG: transcriptional regulator, TrmB [uncultured bacterium]